MENYLYAITFKDGTILSPDSFREYWQKYGSNTLHGWSKPKKIYTTFGMAKIGFAHIPKELKPLVQISKFKFDGEVIGGEDLLKEQAKKKQEKEIRLAEKRLALEKKEADEKRAKELEELKRLKEKYETPQS